MERRKNRELEFKILQLQQDLAVAQENEDKLLMNENNIDALQKAKLQAENRQKIAETKLQELSVTLVDSEEALSKVMEEQKHDELTKSRLEEQISRQVRDKIVFP